MVAGINSHACQGSGPTLCKSIGSCITLSVSTVHASNAACVHVQRCHQREGSKADLNMCVQLADALPGLAHVSLLEL